MTYWFIAASLVLILELFAGTIYLLVVSAALFGAGLSAFLFNNNLNVSIITAAVLASVGTAWANRWIKRHRLPGNGDASLNDLDIGQTVHINRRLHGNVYEVHYRGSVWQAEAANTQTASQPQTAVITGKKGNILLINLH